MVYNNDSKEFPNPILIIQAATVGAFIFCLFRLLGISSLGVFSLPHPLHV